MESNETIRVRMYIPAALILGGIGWLGLLFVFFYTLPTIGPRWLFFFFAVLALSGTTLPFIAYLHVRFPSKPVVSSNVVLRQSILVGIYFPTIAWLQIGRVLTLGLAILLASGMIILELILKMREKSLWKPDEEKELND